MPCCVSPGLACPNLVLLITARPPKCQEHLGTAFGDAYNGSTDRQPGERRNSDRLPWSKVFDVSLQYNLPIRSESRRLEVRADVFNVLNTNNLSGYSNNATQSNQIQVGPRDGGFVQRNAAPPRQFQFGARYLF